MNFREMCKYNQADQDEMLDLKWVFDFSCSQTNYNANAYMPFLTYDQ